MMMMMMRHYYGNNFKHLPIRFSCCDICGGIVFSVTELPMLFNDFEEIIKRDTRSFLTVTLYSRHTDLRQMIDYIRGERPDELQHMLPVDEETFGVGRTKPTKYWFGLAEFLIQQGMISYRSSPDVPTLTLEGALFRFTGQNNEAKRPLKMQYYSDIGDINYGSFKR